MKNNYNGDPKLILFNMEEGLRYLTAPSENYFKIKVYTDPPKFDSSGWLVSYDRIHSTVLVTTSDLGQKFLKREEAICYINRIHKVIINKKLREIETDQYDRYAYIEDDPYRAIKVGDFIRINSNLSGHGFNTRLDIPFQVIEIMTEVQKDTVTLTGKSATITLYGKHNIHYKIRKENLDKYWHGPDPQHNWWFNDYEVELYGEL